ncbi:MAG: D-aminoacyl-tRNA deacylase [bacterium]
MRAVVQRVREASVMVDGAIVGAIGSGLLVLLGVHREDTVADVTWMAHKLLNLRILADADGKLNESVLQQSAEILVVSQFTLYGDARKGFRPSFIDAAPAAEGEVLYRQVVHALEQGLGRPVPTGSFGAMMDVQLINDGPVTIILDSPALA